MALVERIVEDLIRARKQREPRRQETLKMLVAVLRNEAIAKRRAPAHAESNSSPEELLSDEEVATVVRREVHRRKEAIEAYAAGSREDLAQKEREERAILEAYLPAQLAEADIEERARALIAALGATRAQDFGKVMGALMKELGGQADGQIVKAIVERLLAKEG